MSALAERLAQQKQLRAEAKAERQSIAEKAIAEKRDFTGQEEKRFRRLTDQIAGHDERIDDITNDLVRAGHGDPNVHSVRASTYGGGASASIPGQHVLTRGEKVADWAHEKGLVKSVKQPSFDRWLRGVVTGKWDDADEERTLSVGTSTAGGHLVPTPLASNIIDLARNQTRVVPAGAVTVPMTSSTLKVARLVGEGAPAWRNENAPIAAGDLTFDAVTFSAKSLDRLVIMSRELFEDSDPAASDVIARSFAAQLALELDRVALRGSGGTPEPRGVLNTPGITTTNHGANGSAIANFDWLLDAAGAVRNANFEPNAHIVAPRTTTSFSKLKDNNGNYLSAPTALLPILPTKQVPTTLTVGTSTDASEVYTGQWDQLAIGIRTDFELRLLTERYADNGQVAFLAHLRADVQVLQPSAFAVDLGVRA